jgi:hypothetical protein
MRLTDKLSLVDAETHAHCLIRELSLDRGDLHDQLRTLELSELVTPNGVLDIGCYVSEDIDDLTLSCNRERLDFLLPPAFLRKTLSKAAIWESRSKLHEAVALVRQTADAAHRLTGVSPHPSIHDHFRQMSAAVALAIAAPAARLRAMEMAGRLTAERIAGEFGMPRDIATSRLEGYVRMRAQLLKVSHRHHETLSYFRRKTFGEAWSREESV